MVYISAGFHKGIFLPLEQLLTQHGGHELSCGMFPCSFPCLTFPAAATLLLQATGTFQEHFLDSF